MMSGIDLFIAQPYNNPAGADWMKILVALYRLLAAAQPERYAAQS
jgi:hypothetical protein